MNNFCEGDIVECVATVQGSNRTKISLPKSRVTIRAVNWPDKKLEFVAGKSCNFADVIKHWKLQPVTSVSPVEAEPFQQTQERELSASAAMLRRR
jgi:copper chaperone CopZ